MSRPTDFAAIGSGSKDALVPILFAKPATVDNHRLHQLQDTSNLEWRYVVDQAKLRAELISIA